MDNAKQSRRIRVRQALASAAVLAVITGGVAAMLAGINALTQATAAAMKENAGNAVRRQVIGADSFERRTLTDGEQEIVYHAARKNGELTGYVFAVSTTGKSAGLSVVTGISPDGVITGVTVAENNETAGYMDRVKEAGLPAAFSGKAADRPLTLGTDIDGVSGATMTSRGITDGVNRAIALYNAYVKETEKP